MVPHLLYSQSNRNTRFGLSFGISNLDRSYQGVILDNNNNEINAFSSFKGAYWFQVNYEKSLVDKKAYKFFLGFAGSYYKIQNENGFNYVNQSSDLLYGEFTNIHSLYLGPNISFNPRLFTFRMNQLVGEINFSTQYSIFSSFSNRNYDPQNIIENKDNSNKPKNANLLLNYSVGIGYEIGKIGLWLTCGENINPIINPKLNSRIRFSHLTMSFRYLCLE